MIELTNERILALNKSLNDLQDSKIALNIRVSYKLARIKRIVQSFVNTIQEEQMKLYKKYGEPQDDDTIKIPAEKMNEFTKDYKELLNINNDVDIEPISVGDLDEVEIDLDIMEGLVDILKD